MAEDIKATLYALLGRKKLGIPQYNVQEDRRGKVLRFKCEVRVPNMSYIGLGSSTNKKDAMSNAARDFGLFLIRDGHCLNSDLPNLMEGDLESVNIDQKLWGASKSSPFAANQLPPPPQVVHEESVFSGPAVPAAPRQKTAHEEYVDQKALQVAQAENVDMGAEIHGGWVMENCKRGLNEYCQKLHLPVPSYEVKHLSVCGNTNNFEAKYSMHVAAINKILYARGEGSTKKVAETICALSIVRQLYHHKLMPHADAPSTKKQADNLPPISVSLDKAIIERIIKYLDSVGLVPASDLESASPGNPIPLLLDQKLVAFPDSEPCESYPIIWAPPYTNWNAWRSTNIDEKPLAFMQLDEISVQLMEEERSKTIPPYLGDIRKTLPVYQVRQDIIEAVNENNVVLIKGATGCGKSTQVCQYLMEHFIDSGRGANFNAYVTQPRRISAITLAERVAEERGEPLGVSVGYGVRFDSIVPRPYGAVMFVTVGVLVRKMETGMRGISHVIVDEIHERDINTDFLLIIVRELVRNNPKLRVILMSATIDTEMFSNYFGTSKIIEINERANEVQHFFLEDVINFLQYMPPLPDETAKKKKRKSNNGSSACVNDDDNEDIGTVDDAKSTFEDIDPSYGVNTQTAISRMNESEIPLDLIEALLVDIHNQGAPGAILVFLPGWNIIALLLNRLQNHPVFGDKAHTLVLPLHSQLTGQEQHRVFESVSSDVRKIILSTNIAETSVTINDVVFVIDSCRAREKIQSSRNNLIHFATVWASRTSIVQRRGRAGRVQKGFCFHLCTKKRFEMLDEHRTPEILRTPLNEIALSIKLLRLGQIFDFLEKAIQPPPLDNVVEAEIVLKEIQALDTNNELTDLGRILARMPISPILGKVIILGAAVGVGDMFLTFAAASSFNMPYVQMDRRHSKLSYRHRAYAGKHMSDHLGLVVVNQRFRERYELGEGSMRKFCADNWINPTTLTMSNDSRRQMRDVLINSRFPESCFAEFTVDPNSDDRENLIGLFTSIVVQACYPNVAYIRDKRRVFTLEQTTALISKMSVCVPFDNTHPIEFQSPLFIFTEKVVHEVPCIGENNNVAFQMRTNVISCHTISSISPLQLLLFGSKRVVAVDRKRILLDDMISLEMPAHLAAKVVALRPAIDALIVRACQNPEQLGTKSSEDLELIQLLKDLSAPDAWSGDYMPSGPKVTPASSTGYHCGPIRAVRHTGAHFPPRPAPYDNRGRFGSHRSYGSDDYGSYRPRATNRYGSFGADYYRSQNHRSYGDHSTHSYVPINSIPHHANPQRLHGPYGDSTALTPPSASAACGTSPNNNLSIPQSSPYGKVSVDKHFSPSSSNSSTLTPGMTSSLTLGVNKQEYDFTQDSTQPVPPMPIFSREPE